MDVRFSENNENIAGNAHDIRICFMDKCAKIIKQNMAKKSNVFFRKLFFFFYLHHIHDHVTLFSLSCFLDGTQLAMLTRRDLDRRSAGH